MLKAVVTDSLEKIFPDTELEGLNELKSEKIFANQIYGFQVVLRTDETNIITEPVIESEIAPYITLRTVENVPCVITQNSDTYTYGNRELFPDPLMPLLYGGRVRVTKGRAHSIWVEVNPENKISGRHKIKIAFYGIGFGHGVDAVKGGLYRSDEKLCEIELELEISTVNLPEQTLMFTQWFHTDGLAVQYNVKPFSKAHFKICRRFIAAAVRAGRTMILTPLLTPPLDTYQSGERLTTQLVKITKDGDDYSFDFTLLGKWLDMCRECGVKQYEIAHLFTQWGAHFAPKVVAIVNGRKKKICGWETKSESAEYISFLRRLLPAFLDYMKARGEDKKCWFHISDEPTLEHLEQYKTVKNAVADILEGYPIMDALSNYDFYEQGVTTTPIPAIAHIKPFLDNNVPDLWCYYCGFGNVGNSNLFIAQTLSETRFLGTQLFKYNIKGFLQWGYNFYNSQWSYDAINPYMSPDSGNFAPGGDGFTVYPGLFGQPVESIRMRALYEGIEDMRAMQLAEALYSHDFVVSEIEKITGTVVFDKCVKDAKQMLAVRRRINGLIFDKTE